VPLAASCRIEADSVGGTLGKRWATGGHDLALRERLGPDFAFTLLRQ
jgi:hypothetical protein